MKMTKICYRTRKYQIIILILVTLSIIYYISLHSGLKGGLDLDITRRYIESRIQEALKDDKGTVCEMPKLDPFAKEVTQFDKVKPKVVCDGRDWVKCYLHECRVVPYILETTQDIKCTYKDIVHESDNKYHLGPPKVLTGEQVYVLTKSDHVKISCSGKHGDSYLPSKWTGHAAGFRTGIEPRPQDKRKYNVMIVGFDSTSKNAFIRRMPRSYRVLLDELGAVILNGYNIIGDGTPAALFPILTGKTELELPDARKSGKGNATLDDMPFIFYKLKKEGYRTAYFEDMPWIGTFQYRFVGFKRQPADHYLRSFYLEESGNGKKFWSKNANTKYCVGDTPQYALMLNLTQQFFELDGNKFIFTFIADITHDDFNMISTADDDLVEFLRDFKKKGLGEDTLLMVMGDHGMRYANVRSTLQGKLEERLPLMAIVYPPELKNEATVSNADRLTTPRDIHVTIMRALGLEYDSGFKVPGADLPRQLSLFEPIPKNRSCSEAAIEPHWCACMSWRDVTRDGMRNRVAQELVQFINSITEDQRALCAPRTLKSIEYVMRQRAKEEFLKFDRARDADGYIGTFTANTQILRENYQAKIAVGPGHGVYEASMVYVVKEDRFEFNIRDISRINAYGTQPHCISDLYPHLNMYCYCKD